jgi:CubicO group peptidase (beta-lactamase class C family)
MSLRSTLVSFLVAAPAFASAQSLSSKAPPPRFTDPDRVAKLERAMPVIDSLMRAFAQRERVPGIAYGVIIDGKVVHIGTAGLRDVAANAPVDTNTVFRIASMTKSFTALAILRLRDEGKLSLDDPAERYVPELRGLTYPTTDSPKLTVRYLLSHSTGFPEDNPWGDQQLADSEEQLSAMLRRGIPFSTSPGTNYEYSNLGFAILGRIVSNVSGMPYTRYVRQNVLLPLGMTSTTLEVAQVPANRLAHGYRLQDGQWLEEAQLANGSFGSMGGMLTSVSDLGKWVAYLLDAWPPRDGEERGPVKRSSRREMQQLARFGNASVLVDTAANTISLSAGGYGYGLGVTRNCDFAAIISHTGGLPGFGSIMRWLPDYGVGIVAMGNRTYTGWNGVVGQAFDALRRTGALEPRAPQPAPVLLTRRDQVVRLVSGWDDALADSLAAMNLYRDESKPRRRAAIEKLVSSVGGDCHNEGPFVVENALRGRWRMRCATGDIGIGITLAPTLPATVQYLEVRPLRREASIAAQPFCRFTP